MKVLICAIFLLASVPAFAQEGAMDASEKATAMQLATFCSACHGQGGFSDASHMATIKGQNMEYLANTLNEFASGERYSTLMGIVSKGYDPEERMLIAKHYASTAWKASAVEVDAKLAMSAEALAEENCSSCHNADQSDYVPRIEGQQAAVLYRALLQYKGEQRNGENSGEMSLVMDFTDAQLKALAEFYAGME